MSFAVKELFHTLQGEGVHSGRSAVFCRFSGCNLWSGREADRDFAVCGFCDTDFVGVDGSGGGTFSTAAKLAVAIADTWNLATGSQRNSFVVFTGGEPLLQLDRSLIEAVHGHGFTIAVETNGTLDAPAGIDWICVSPKGAAPLRLRRGNELKLVYPQANAPPEEFADLPFDHFFLQPMAGPHEERNREMATEYCLRHPQWRLGIQMHKVVNIR